MLGLSSHRRSGSSSRLIQVLAEFSSLSCRAEDPVFLPVLARVILSPKSPTFLATFLATFPPNILMAGREASLSLDLESL